MNLAFEFSFVFVVFFVYYTIYMKFSVHSHTHFVSSKKSLTGPLAYGSAPLNILYIEKFAYHANAHAAIREQKLKPRCVCHNMYSDKNIYYVYVRRIYLYA